MSRVGNGEVLVGDSVSGAGSNEYKLWWCSRIDCTAVDFPLPQAPCMCRTAPSFRHEQYDGWVCSQRSKSPMDVSKGDDGICLGREINVGRIGAIVDAA